MPCLAATPMTAVELAAALKAEAVCIGFDLVGIAPAIAAPGFGDFTQWLDAGLAGEMGYLERRREAYAHPQHVLPQVRSVVMLGMNYHTSTQKMPPPGPGKTARYAWGAADYHDVLRERLKRLADWLHAQRPGCRTRGVVDTAPLLERDFARLAGLGWFGKNTLLIHKRLGSWLFLAALMTDVELPADAPQETAHCGTCTRCLDACPTDAFAGPYVLDARKCISYLTIELRDRPIPVELRAPMGDWLFGCDVCQEVCPWNRKAPVTDEPAFQPAEDLAAVDAIGLLSLSEEEFEAKFAQTPPARPGRAGMLRNACIVLGNAGNAAAAPALIQSLNDASPLVRGAAAWALGRIGEPSGRAAIAARLSVENDPDVRHECEHALTTFV